MANTESTQNSFSKTWRVIDLINWATEYLTAKNITNGRLEVEWYLTRLLECERIDLYLQFDRPLDPPELRQIKDFIQRRVKGEPFQYILGVAPFYGRDFVVNQQVLIPRPETELIIEQLRELGPVQDLLEVGTGSGCLVITALLEGLARHAIATDISSDALQVAKQNSQRLGCEAVSFRRHDFLKDKIQSKFDAIISNPPYVSTDEWPDLENGIRNWEPGSALLDGKDGLSFYSHFARTGHQLLRSGGFMLLETGGDHQRDAVEKIFTQSGYRIQFHKDLQGNCRVAFVRQQAEGES